jgi:hypothetical protein
MAGWQDHELFVVKSLERIEGRLEKVECKLSDVQDVVHSLDKDLNSVKIKSTLWGALGGFFTGFIK